MAIQPGEQVGRGRAAQATASAMAGSWLWWRVGRLPIGQEPLVAGVQSLAQPLVDPLGSGLAGPVGRVLASASNSAIPAAQPCPGSSVTASSSRSRCAPHSACVTW